MVFRVISASVCALELGISGAVPLKIGLPAMAGFTGSGRCGGTLTAGAFLPRRVRPT